MSTMKHCRLLLISVVLFFIFCQFISATENSVTKKDELDLDLESFFNVDNPNGTRTYAVILPYLNLLNLSVLLLAVFSILTCSAFCIYYPFVILQTWYFFQLNFQFLFHFHFIRISTIRAAKLILKSDIQIINNNK